jgi:hypothetical protein
MNQAASHSLNEVSSSLGDGFKQSLGLALHEMGTGIKGTLTFQYDRFEVVLCNET